MDPAQLQPGYRLDRYELLCPLAYGGMASVWLARFGGRLGFERMVVIKMILPQYSQDPRFKEMFLDEARIASKIEHSNVARILDVGEENDNYFIVMEWVDGDSLSKILREVEQRKEKIPAGIALRIVADAAAGLHAAHELKARDGTHLGVVHRDVSPQNILVANSGATMIIDFGVAKARDRLSQDTSAGQLKGKIRYMAPEQALGRTVDHRADVWALGAMLYEMFVGAPPYDGPNEVATLHKLTSGQRHAPMPDDIPEPIRDVVARTLGYEPEERFESAIELSLALENVMLEINEPTSSAVVASYTADLLADRKAARRDAVDAALEKARRRDERRAASMQTASGSVGVASDGSGSGVLSGSSHVYSSTPPSGHDAAMSNRVHLGEAPSSATLGSANMEYFADGAEDLRKRRYVTAAALGLSLAAALIGIILIYNAVRPSTGRPDHVEDLAPPPSASIVTPLPTGPNRQDASVTTATVAPTAPPTAVAPTASATSDSRQGDARTRGLKPIPPGSGSAKPIPAIKPSATATTNTSTTPAQPSADDPWGLMNGLPAKHNGK